MSTHNRSQWLVKVAVAVALIGMPLVSQAQSPTSVRGVWMATSAEAASLAGRGFGRLVVTDGSLTFQSPNYEWRLELAEVKRISTSKALANTIEVEDVAGQIFYVAVLDAQLVPTSPGKAIQTIERAVATAPAPVVPARATAIVAAGGSIR